ncbi:MAG: hypothetical protein ACI9BD_000105 [Candidatus Marinamargulisbacteria bacterium]
MSVIGHSVAPYQKGTLVTDIDLAKFGVDGTKKMQPALVGGANGYGIEAALAPLYMPQIFSASISDDVIEIFQWLRRKMAWKMYKVKVNRETGALVKPKSAFKHVARFNPDTFPEDKSRVPLKNVGYWNTRNQYVSSLEDETES